VETHLDSLTDLGYTSGISYKNISKQTLEEKIFGAFNDYTEAIRIISKCPKCRELYKKSSKLRNHQEGGPSTDSSRLTEVIDNAKICREII
jgi:hypothetical protein